MLSRVVGVDVDVLVGQVGGPENAGAVALVEIDGDGELRLLNVGVCGVLVELRGSAAVAADGKLAEGDVDAFGIDLAPE